MFGFPHEPCGKVKNGSKSAGCFFSQQQGHWHLVGLNQIVLLPCRCSDGVRVKDFGVDIDW